MPGNKSCNLLFESALLKFILERNSTKHVKNIKPEMPAQRHQAKTLIKLCHYLKETNDVGTSQSFLLTLHKRNAPFSSVIKNCRTLTLYTDVAN